MCGIFGTIGFHYPEQEFQKRLNLLAHRGPDGAGTWFSEDLRVQLGHRRLAIIDTDSRSNQPMLLGDRYVIVYNGEIYNYLELRKELEQEGVRFQTGSDTEVLLHLLALKGPSVLNRLNGMWAFVLYDQKEQSCFISRDRLGKKPLYYVEEDERFAFASEMKSLYSCLKSFQYNQSFIAFAVAHPNDNEVLPETLIKGIKKFPAGSYGWLRNGKLSIERYYEPEQLLEQPLSRKSFEEAVEEFRELFQSSCSLRMRSDVPVGSALSGGIDSGFVVSSIGQLHSPTSYTALIASFPGSFLDETDDALLAANNAGVQSLKVKIEPDVNPDHILQAVYDFEEIGGTAPFPFFQTYRAFREQGILVTLDGHGGDELFGGYSFDLSAKLHDDFPNIYSIRNTLALRDRMTGLKRETIWPTVWGNFKSIALQKKKKGLLPLFFEREQYYRKQLFHSTFRGILPTLLRNYDRYSMYAGVEVRMPFLDYRLVEFAFRLPNNYKIRHGYSKAIVREAGKPIMPKQILQNKLKTGWNSPTGEWFGGIWKEWLRDELAGAAYKKCDLVNKEVIDTLAAEFLEEGKKEHEAGQNLWLQLQPYLIEQANKKLGIC